MTPPETRTLREAAQGFIDHLDSAPKRGWVDNDPAMLTWAATEYRLQEVIRAALAPAPESSDAGLLAALDQIGRAHV